MSAPTRLRAADPRFELWSQAAATRDEWRRISLDPGPADRASAESAIAAIYAHLNRPAPAFVWAASPAEAAPLITDRTSLDDLHRLVMRPALRCRSPIASDLAAYRSRLRARLDLQINPAIFDPPPPKRDKRSDPWPPLPPEPPLRFGIPLSEVVRRHVRDALRATLQFRSAVRAALGPPQAQPICWYARHDVDWIGYADVWRRLGLASYSGADTSALDDWATLARSAGWWWAADSVCVMSEPPSRVDLRGPTEVVALTWPDGWRVTV